MATLASAVACELQVDLLSSVQTSGQSSNMGPELSFKQGTPSANRTGAACRATGHTREAAVDQLAGLIISLTAIELCNMTEL